MNKKVIVFPFFCSEKSLWKDDSSSDSEKSSDSESSQTLTGGDLSISLKILEGVKRDVIVTHHARKLNKKFSEEIDFGEKWLQELVST